MQKLIKYIINLNVEPKTTKLLEESIGKKNLCEVGMDRYFLGTAPNT